MAQDKYQRIRERFDDAKDVFSEQRARMVEDLRFSNPTNPEQWEPDILRLRGPGRPSMTFDLTNQYVAQVVNDSRQNKPQIQTVPASSGADQKVSDVLDGMIRQIEYASNAAIAYDTAQEHAARIGRGWLRVITEVVDPEYNLQELRIRPVIDPLSVIPGPYTLPNGEDMMHGFVESRIQCDAYELKYGKRKNKPATWSDDGWENEDELRISEYFEVVEEKTNNLVVMMPDGQRLTMPEADYWDLAKKIGFKPEVVGSFQSKKQTVEWSKLNGDDFIEDSTTFPGKWVPIVPVHGYETWIEGKRSLCGMVRRMMPAQRAYNMERSAYLETVALSPKAPFIAATEAIEGFENLWARANEEARAYLPYNHRDEVGDIPMPQRQQPPVVGAAFAQSMQIARSDLEASIGMFAANLGKQGNETSGVAIKRREQQGDTANFHYIDNLARSMGHLGKIIVGAIPTVYADQDYGPRDVRTLGIEGTSAKVVIDGGAPKPHLQTQDGTVVINPMTGQYDVRVKVGPAYASLREELSQRLSEMSRGNPQLGAALAPLLTQMMDMPESEKISKICLALLPPNVQAAYNDDQKKPEIPPEVMAQVQQQGQMLQQFQQALQNAHEQVQQLTIEKKYGIDKVLAQGTIDQRLSAIDNQSKLAIEKLRADAAHDREELKGMVQMLLNMMTPPPSLADEEVDKPPEEVPA